MPTEPSTREDLASAYAAIVTHATLHTGDPGSTGANEVNGNGYAALEITWVAGAVDGQYVSEPLAFDVPICDVLYVATWDGDPASTGTLRDKAEVLNGSCPEPGTFTLTLTYDQE